jgi:hypothetical protein
MKRKGFLALAFVVALCVSTLGQQPAVSVDAGELALKPTNHPRLPSDLSQLWLVPAPATGSGRAAPARGAAIDEFVAAVKLEVDSNFAKALPILVQPSVQQGTLGHYAEHYQGSPNCGSAAVGRRRSRRWPRRTRSVTSWKRAARSGCDDVG